MADKDFKVKKGLKVTENIELTGNLKGPAVFNIEPKTVGTDSGTVRILGKLQVEGTTTVLNSTTVTINDKNIVLADSATNATAADGAGITINGANATLTYAQASDRFVFNKNIQAANFIGNVTGNLTGNITGTVSDLSNHTLYTDSDFDASFALASTDSLSEGTTNLYHTTARVRTNISGDKGISYNNSTGVIDVDSTNITSIARGAVSGTGALTYNAANGQFSFVSGQSGLIDSSLAQGMIDSNFSSIDSLNVTGTITAGTINASNITGDGSGITGAGLDSALIQQLVDSNLTAGKNITAGNIAGTLTTAAQTNITSVGTLTGVVSSANIDINADNQSLRLGASQDLQLKHDGSHSQIVNSTGILKIAGDDVRIHNAAISETYMDMAANGTVQIYYDNSVKLATVTGGVNVTGTLTATALAGTLSTAAQTNITSVGTLGSLAVTNLSTIGGAQFTGNITPTSGQGVEIFVANATSGTVQSFDRTGGHFEKLILKGNIVELNHAGTVRLVTSGSGVDVTGNIAVSGTVDGRDVATDGTKLDGIDTSATANPITGASSNRIITSGGGKALTAQADFQFDGTNLFIPAEMRHLGDPDTKLGFTTDTITLTAGGSTAQTITSASTTIGGNAIVTGNLTVNGTTTTINSTTLDVDDLNITVAKGAADAAAANGAGLTVDGASATLLYQNTGDKWVFNKPLEATSFTGVISATTLTANTLGGFSHLSAVGGGGTVDIVVTVATKTAAHRYNGTGSGLGYVLDGVQAPYLTLTPGRTYKFKQDDNSNSGHPFRFYYDAAKTTAYTTNVTTQGSGGSAGDYTQIVVDENTPPVLFYQCSAHGFMGNAVRMGTRNNTGLTTDGLTEGSTNLYYTTARQNTDFDTRLGTKSTANLTEGSNLYYTNARADARIAAADLSDLNNVTGVPSTGQILSWNGSNWVPANDAGGLDSALTKQLIDSAHIGKINIGDLNNVATTAPSSGQVLKWNGSAWAPAADATGGGGGSQNLFSTIAVSGQSDVVADATTDTLTLVAGSNMTITTNAGSDTITFASTGGGGGSGDITSVVAGTGLSGGATSGDATLNVDVGTTANKIVQLDGSARLPAVDGSQLTGVGGALTIQEEGSSLSTAATTLNFVGSAVTATGSGATKTITVSASTGVDSSLTTQLIDSDYVQARMLGINSSKITEFKYIADSGDTVFSGNDANGNALAISATNHEVYLNGIRLLSGDFTASASANSITLGQSVDSADEVVIVTQGSLTTNDRFVVGAGTQRFFFNADSGQTAFTGNDKHGNALAFDSGQIDVYLNGILLTNEDIIQNGTTNTLTLTAAADSADDVAIIAYNGTLAAEFSAGTGTLNTFKYTLSAAQTAITGADLKGNTLAYVPGNQQVFLNGLLLEDSDDYTTTSTGTLTLTSGANASDEIIIQDYASKFSGNTAGIINPEFKEFKYIADSGDTVFSGNDETGQALLLTSGNQEVFLNGIRLLASDYTANTATNAITLQGFTAADSDEVVISTLVGNVRFNSASSVESIVDSAYVAARSSAGTDSSSVISLINSTVNVAYVKARQSLLDSDLALQLLLDSSEIIDLIDSAYVAARVGTVAQATQATKVYVDESEDDNVSYNITFVETNPGGNSHSSMQVDNGGLTFNPQQNRLFVAGQTQITSTSSTIGGLLTLSTADTTIVDGNKLGAIQFKASSEASGIDATAVAAEITAEADATFTSSVNQTDLVFKLGTSGAATEKARLTHEGNLSATSFSGDGSGLTGISAIDSALTIQLIDSAYVNSKFDGTVDPKFTDFLFTADSGATAITGLSNAGDSLSIGTNNFAVFLNGIKLQGTDFVDSSANNIITLNNGLDSGDEILVQTVTSTRTSSSTAILETVDSAYIQQRLSEMVPATSSFSTFRYVSTEGQSVYTGNDIGGTALSYDSAQIQIFLNGLLLTKVEDFSLQNKNQITLLDSVNVGSELVINNYATNFRATAAFSDSSAVTSMIDSAYVQARALSGQTYNATSSNITLVKGNAYIVDTSSARTLTLPATGTLGDEVKVIDGTGQAGTNNITINRNGHKIQGLTDNLVINVNRAAQGLVYYNATQGWILSEN